DLQCDSIMDAVVFAALYLFLRGHVSSFQQQFSRGKSVAGCLVFLDYVKFLLMFRPLSCFIGMRYTRAKRRNHFISFISLTSMIGLTLGVMVMIVVLSVMNGFDHELRTRILGMVPHATVSSYTPLDDWQAVAEQVGQHQEVVATA